MPELPLKAGCQPRCRACAHRRLPVSDSEGRKMDWLGERLAPWREALAPLAGAGEEPWDYRDKVRLHCQWQEGWQFGFLTYREFIPVPHCPVHSPRARAVIAALTPRLPPPDVFPLAFYAQSGTQATLILKSAGHPPRHWLDEGLGDELAAAGLEGLWLHLHPSAGRRLFAKNGWQLLWGRPRSRDTLGLLHGPASFQQLIPALYARSLAEAEDFLAPGPGTAVVDLYSGIGASLQRWTGRGAAALGVELDGEAVACARDNAPTAQVLRGACAQRLPQVDDWLADRPGPRRLYANPPRMGLEPEVLAWIIGHGRPRRLAYLSCSAGTLARDLTGLTSAGYRVIRLRPYDFFPRTHHVETLALLALD